MCCGQKRSALKFDRAPNPITAQPTAFYRVPGVARASAGAQRSHPLAPTSYSSVRLRYLENSPIRVRGPVTGRHYEFSSPSPVQSVDPRDVAGLLGTRLFRST